MGLGDLKTIKFFMAHGADVNFKMGGRLTPLLLAANAGRQSVAELLLSAGAYPGDRDKNGDTPLGLAARNGHLETVKSSIGVSVDRGRCSKYYGANRSYACRGKWTFRCR